MRLSKTELKILWQVALGKNQVPEIAIALLKDKSQIYRTVQRLESKGFAKLDCGNVVPSKNTHAHLLLQELSRRPNIINNLSGCGIALFTAILEPLPVSRIIRETGIKKSMVFYKLHEAGRNSFVNTSAEGYFFNGRIWPKMREFLAELKEYEANLDRRVPPGAVIFLKNEHEIVFSTRIECDAALTGFSAYDRFGIRILPVDNTYYLPKKTLTKQEVFLHSLYRADKDGDARDYILIALFYSKHRTDLQGISHVIVDNIKKILRGEKVKNYPSLQEIKDRGDAYDIRI
jgi:hypothetical protein